jgi:tight adherence protein B
MVGTIYAAIFVAVAMIVYVISSASITQWRRWQEKQVRRVANRLDDSFVFLEKRKLALLTGAPVLLGIAGYILFAIPGAVIGVVAGFLTPMAFVSMARQARIKQFQGQLVDTLMIFSSSLKGGLSFIQALEIVCEEMPAPVNQEFGLILKENKLGVSLEDSLQGLRRRMPLEEVSLIVSSILVAKETGGELTRVFSRLVDTIRDKLKLKEKIDTLTLQGKLQGYIMSVLPFVFTIFVYKQNPEHFLVFRDTQTGKMMLVIAVVLQIVGMFLIRVFGKLKV